MGIKFLNRYLINKCKKTSISCTSLQRFSGKTIVIDAYIYIYKFLGEDKLLENMDRMVSMFLNFKITPIFIFDGKPPQEKQTLLYQRREKKQEAEDKYKTILQQIGAAPQVILLHPWHVKLSQSDNNLPLRICEQ